MTKISKIFISLAALLTCSCSLLDIEPDQVVSTDKAFSDVESYQMALNNAYRNLVSSTMTMQGSDFAGDDYISIIPGYNSTNYSIYYWDYVTQPQSPIWNYQYSLVANLNVVIDNYNTLPELSAEEEILKDQIYAQALAMRSWALFNVAMLYAPHYDGTNGDELGIPLKLKLELEFLPRSPLKDVYKQIFADLEQAEQMLIDSKYAPVASKRTYEFGINAIRALRARVALYVGDTSLAATASKNFIDTELYSAESYDDLWSDTFTDANREIIFMSHDLSDTTDGDFLDYYEILKGNNAVLNREILALFTPGDIRRDSRYIPSTNIPSKYYIEAEGTVEAKRQLHYKHFRIAEQYLIYAESVVESDPTEALRVINKLRTARSAEPLTAAPTKAEIVDERRRELFAEGLRFYDLKRLSKELKITVVRANGKTLSPSSPLYVWDIPISETNSNPNI